MPILCQTVCKGFSSTATPIILTTVLKGGTVILIFTDEGKEG